MIRSTLLMHSKENHTTHFIHAFSRMFQYLSDRHARETSVELFKTHTWSLCLMICSLTGLCTGCGELSRDQWISPYHAGDLEEPVHDDQFANQYFEELFPERSCADTPLVTWSTFGQGFMTNYCQGCHGSETLNRYGAPTAVTFDTLDQVKSYQDRLLDLIVGSKATMPPGGGISHSDAERLIVWITCASEMK